MHNWKWRNKNEKIKQWKNEKIETDSAWAEFLTLILYKKLSSV